MTRRQDKGVTMTEVELRNRELAMRWQDAWNDDAMRMVDECYAEDCEVWDMVRGQCLRGAHVRQRRPDRE